MTEEELKTLKNLSLKARVLSVVLCNYLDAKERDMTPIGKAELQFLKDLPSYIEQAISLNY